MGKRNKKLPALSQFLDYCKPKIPPLETPDANPWIALIVLTYALGAFIIFSIMGVFSANPSPTLAPLVLWTALLGSLVLMKSAFEIARVKFAGRLAPHNAWGTISHLYRKKEDSSLHRSMHPLAAAVLEVGAEHWVRIENSLNSPFFSEDPVPEHWRKLKSRIRREAEYSMMSLIRSLSGLLYAGSGVEVEAISDLRDQKFSDLDELRRWLVRTAYPQPMKHRLMQSIPSGATQLWELMRLAREIESLPLTAIEHPFLFEAPPSRIDSLLKEMSEARQAEEELQEVQVVGGDAQS